jgi:hypothetical protein
MEASSISEPDVAHRYCVLRSSDDVGVMFWPIFPDFRLSVGWDASALSARFTSGGFTLKNRRNLTVRGRSAVLLEFTAPDGKTDLNLLVLRKWPATFLIAISGSANGTSWKKVIDSLPKAVEIR